MRVSGLSDYRLLFLKFMLFYLFSAYFGKFLSISDSFLKMHSHAWYIVCTLEMYFQPRMPRIVIIIDNDNNNKKKKR